ncbi:hypothetical protein EMCRGX_G019766 [Ephydatia muelleri]
MLNLRITGRQHTAKVTEIKDTFVGVEWFENKELKGKEVDFESLYALNAELYKKVEKPTSKIPTLAHAKPVINPKEAEVTANGPAKAQQQLPSQQQQQPLPQQQQLLPQQPALPPPPQVQQQQQQQQPVALQQPQSQQQQQVQHPSQEQLPLPNTKGEAQDNVPVKQKKVSDPTAQLKEKPLAAKGRKSNCVKEVEKLKKNREERRAKQAVEVAKKSEDYDTSTPNWEFLQKIREYRSQLDMRPLRVTAEVSDNKISVCVRKRPLNKKELSKKEIDVVTIPDKSSMLVHEPKQKVDLTKYLENQNFCFDYSFDETVSNEVVYHYTAKPLTGSGKTHTMGGAFVGKEQDAAKGVYALAAGDVFQLNSLPQNKSKELSVNASFFEIYNGKVYDLLNKKKKLQILEDAKQLVQVVGLKEEPVHGVGDVLQLIQIGNQCRTSGTTSANQTSSRSHAVFQIVLRKRSGRLHGKFSLIDLAGNERGVDTASSDRQTRMEGAEINKSLLALKECIRALGRKGAHLPFRGSKLTLVLKDSFAGDNSRTCMIAMISPGLSCCEHTLNTLRYADRVKELRSGNDAQSAVAPASPSDDNQLSHSPDPFYATPPLSPEQSDLKYLHQSMNAEGISRLDKSSELLTFHEAVKELEDAEDELVEKHTIILHENDQWIADLKKWREYVDNVDHDLEAYVNAVEGLVQDKMVKLTEVSNCIADIKRKMAYEETASKNIRHLPPVV